jgi:recombination protein RecR
MQSPIEHLSRLLARLPGLGPRSARRIVLLLLQERENLMLPLAAALEKAACEVRTCSLCGNLGETDPCSLCASPTRDRTTLCVVEDVAALWALERSRAFKGLYHTLGGTLSALEGRSPADLKIDSLVARARNGGIKEIILALGATVEGQTTAHYIAERLAGLPITISRLAQGVPMGGELDYLDEGTLTAALTSRRSV